MSTYRCPAGHSHIRPDLPCRECALGILALHNRDFGQQPFEYSYAAPHQAQQQGISQPYRAPMPGPPPFSNQQFGVPQQGQSQFDSSCTVPYQAQQQDISQPYRAPMPGPPPFSNQQFGVPQQGQSQFDNSYAAPQQAQQQGISQPHRAPMPGPPPFSNQQSGAPQQGQFHSAGIYPAALQQAHTKFEQQAVPPSASYFGLIGAPSGSQNTMSAQSGWWPSYTQPQQPLQGHGLPGGAPSGAPPAPLPDQLLRSNSNTVQPPRSPLTNVSDREHGGVNLPVSAQFDSIQSPTARQPSSAATQSRVEASRHADQIFVPSPPTHVPATNEGRTTASHDAKRPAETQEQDDPAAFWNDLKRLGLLDGFQRADTPGKHAFNAPQMTTRPLLPSDTQGLILFPRLYNMATELKKAIYDDNTVTGSELIQKGHVFMRMLQAANETGAMRVYNALKTLKLDEVPADHIMTHKDYASVVELQLLLEPHIEEWIKADAGKRPVDEALQQRLWYKFNEYTSVPCLWANRLQVNILKGSLPFARICASVLDPYATANPQVIALLEDVSADFQRYLASLYQILYAYREQLELLAVSANDMINGCDSEDAAAKYFAPSFISTGGIFESYQNAMLSYPEVLKLSYLRVYKYAPQHAGCEHHHDFMNRFGPLHKAALDLMPIDQENIQDLRALGHGRTLDNADLQLGGEILGLVKPLPPGAEGLVADAPPTQPAPIPDDVQQ